MFDAMDIFEKKFHRAKEIIYQAGDILMKYMNKSKVIHHKTNINLLTEADKESEEFIFNELLKDFPEDSIIAEEGSEHKGSSDSTWIVDPLDGTTSFAHNFPVFAVSIGLVNSKQEPIIGLVYNPYSQELFHAIKGKGAFLNQQSISVSRVDSLSDSLIGTGFPYNRREIIKKLFERLEQILLTAHDIRRTGSAAMDICFVAAGRYEGYYEEGLKPWDMAAAVLIASEAGGQKSKFNGDHFELFDGEIVVTNGKIHNDLIHLLKKPCLAASAL